MQLLVHCMIIQMSIELPLSGTIYSSVSEGGTLNKPCIVESKMAIL